MKRCPECGYLVNAESIRDCPLCGVRMRNDPNGQTVKLQTHVHENETCLLPNPGEKEVKQQRNPSAMKEQKRAEDVGKIGPMPEFVRKLLISMGFILLYIFVKGCTVW